MLRARNGIILSLIFAFLFSFVSHAHAWGSKAGFNTHWAIIKKAYELLEADPAFDKEKFPAFADMEKFEGSTSGPDGEGLTEFSEHYYNPNFSYPAGMSNAANSAATRYALLVSELGKGKYLEAALPAAWLGHFIADMQVPFHVSGLSRDAILAIYESRKNDKDPILLDKKYFISPKMAYKVAFRSDNFRPSIENFKDFLKSNPGLDWFDPWYYNGPYDYTRVVDNLATITYVALSSHVVWEGLAGAIRSAPNYDLSGFPPGWQNPSIDLNSLKPNAKASDAVYNLAINAAKETQERVGEYMDDANLAFNRSVQRIYTAWRASFSALQPVPNIVKKDDSYMISVYVKNNAAETVKDVKVKLTVGDGKGEIKNLGDVPGGGKPTLKSADWKIVPPEGKSKVKIEVSGKFQNTPDLQYAVTEEDIEGGQGGFVFYEGSAEDLMSAAEKYILGRKAEGEEFKISNVRQDLKPETNVAEKSFSCEKNIQQYADGTWYKSSVYSVTVRIEAPKTVYPGSLDNLQKNLGFSDAKIRELEKRMLEFGMFYTNVSGYAESFGKGEQDQGATALENNISQDLWQEGINKKYAYKDGVPPQDEEFKVWKAQVDIPRKVDGSYHIIYVKRDLNDNLAYYLRVAAANVYVYIGVYDSRSLLKSYPKLSYSVPDAKAILYHILKKLQFSGSDFPVAAPSEKLSPRIILEEKAPAQAQPAAQPASQTEPAAAKPQEVPPAANPSPTVQDIQKSVDEIKNTAEKLGGTLKSLGDIFK